MDGEAYPLHRLLSAPVREGPPLDFDQNGSDQCPTFA
jgi:hypothetical protein